MTGQDMNQMLNTKKSETKRTIINLTHVSKWYGQVMGLNDVTLEFKEGITGLLGPNGAGKSTMFKVITGQVMPNLGTAKIYNKRIWNNYSLWKDIGYCPEYDTFWENMTGEDFLDLLARLYGLPKLEAQQHRNRVLKTVGLSKDAYRKIKGYSKGMRQRLKVAQALLNDPEILILDEPLTGADPLAKRALMNLFQDLEADGKTLIISSHVLEEMEKITDNILLIHKGRLLAEGKIEEIRGLIDKYPHNIFIATSESKKLANRLINEDYVISVIKYLQPRGIMVQTHQPELFYTKIAKILDEESINITQLTSTDDNLDAVFRYLID
jgi:ABC-2 type transport system ATP-binding protein